MTFVDQVKNFRRGASISGTGTRTRSTVEKWVCIRQVEQRFSSFFAKFFAIFDDFSMWSTHTEDAVELLKSHGI